MYTLKMYDASENPSKKQIKKIKVEVSAEQYKLGYVMCGSKVVLEKCKQCKKNMGKCKKCKKIWEDVKTFTPNCWEGIKKARK
tara:strand:- start:1484 stop:1732 length:249 start_codon:yes stop_codon:yes gene_type:complete